MRVQPTDKFLTESRLFVGVLAPVDCHQNAIDRLGSALSREIGEIETHWEAEKGWIAPESYMREMGEDLSTVVFVFDGLWQPLNLAYVKKKTIRIESSFSGSGLRRFNINPGMIDKASMRLASHKPSPLRYSLTKDVWVEEQMRRGASNKLEPLPNIFQEYVMGSRLERLLDLSETVTEQEQKVYGFGKRSVEAGIGSIVRRNV